MFGLGPSEFIIVGIIAILLFGKRLPEVAKSLGSSYTQFRRGLRDIQSELDVSQYTHDNSTSYFPTSGATDSMQDDDYDEPTGPSFAPPPAETEEDSSEKV